MSLGCKEIVAGAVTLLLVLGAVVSNWSSLTTSLTTFIIRSDLPD
jgi:hypothetical protein